MKFCIRSTGDYNTTEDARRFQDAERAYAQHLESVGLDRNGTLWRYFRAGFFHDGVISRMEFSRDCRDFTLEITCPNIKQIHNDGTDFQFVSADFICTFQNVTHFSASSDASDDCSRHLAPCFVSAELDTLLDEATRRSTLMQHSDEQMHSIIVETSESLWLSIFFGSIVVVAREPAAFALMQSHPSFSVPFAE